MPGTKKGSMTSLIAFPGVYTGSYEGQFTVLKAHFNSFVADKLMVSPDPFREYTMFSGSRGAMPAPTSHYIFSYVPDFAAEAVVA